MAAKPATKFIIKYTYILLSKLPYILIGVFILFFLNGMATYPVDEADLEKTFLERVAGNNIESGEIVKSGIHENSITFLFKNANGEIACASYSKSLYSADWREEKFYTSNMSVFNNNELTYEINDKRFVYGITCKIGDNPTIEYGENVSVVLAVKTFGICLIFMAAFLGRLVGLKLRRK